MPIDRLGAAARGAILAILIATIASLPRTAFPYTPERPAVVAMVEHGVAYLEKQTKVPEGAGINDEAGELWLIGLTLIKNGKDESHPLVAAALRRAQLAARPNAVAPQGAIGIYAHALSVIFLCELNPAKHKADISHLLAGLLRILKTLAAEGDLENVPVLIYALGDPDWRVAKEAQDGLRRISRKFDGFGLPERPTYAQRTSAQQSWKQWFLSIRPEAEFLE